MLDTTNAPTTDRWITDMIARERSAVLPEVLAIEPTEADAAAYMAYANVTWTTPAEMLAAPISRVQVQLYVYAGPNPMAHHETTGFDGGWSGALQVLANLNDPNRTKARMGHWLRQARWCRARRMTREVANCLRRAAAERTLMLRQMDRRNALAAMADDRRAS